MERSLVEQAQRGDREAFTRLAFDLSDRLFANNMVLATLGWEDWRPDDLRSLADLMDALTH